MNLLTPDLERAALQALTSYPFLLSEVGIEDQDFIDPKRQAYIGALRETRYFQENGSAAALDVGMRASLEREWVRTELSVAFTIVDQARALVRKLRSASLDRRFYDEMLTVLRETAADGSGARLRRAGDLVRSYAVAESANTTTDMEAVTLAFIDEQKRLCSSGVRVGQSTGMRALDRAIRGWRPGELTTLVAAGGSGKSTLAEWWRRRLAFDKVHTLKFAGEMTEEQEGERSAHAESGRPMGEDLDAAALCFAEDQIREAKVLRYMRLCVRSRFDPAFVRAVIEAEKLERGGLGLVVFDHLRHLNVAKRGMSDYEIVSTAIEEGKAIAKDCSVPLVMVTHTNRAAEIEAKKGNGGDPDPSMIRGSGRIFEDSDNVLCLWRPQHLASLYVWKARQTGVKDMRIQLSYDIRTQDFGEIV